MACRATSLGRLRNLGIMLCGFRSTCLFLLFAIYTHLNPHIIYMTTTSTKVVAVSTGVAVAIALFLGIVFSPEQSVPPCVKETHYITPAGFITSGYDYGTDLNNAQELAGSARLIPIEVCQ